MSAANAAFAAVTGVRGESHDGRALFDYLPGVSGEQVNAMIRAARASGHAEERDVVGETRAAPGATRRLTVVAFPLKVEGKFAGFGLFLRER